MPKNVLIIDDDEELCEELTEILSDRGFRTAVALDGVKGRQLAEKGDFDIIILDLKLPFMDGFELLRWCKGQKKRAKVVVLSGRPLTEEQKNINGGNVQLSQEAEALKLADEVLGKPINPEHLLTILEWV